MEHNKRTSEKGRSVALGDATVYKNGHILEAALLNGIYNASCLRVKPGHERPFLPLWDRRNELEQAMYDTLLLGWFGKLVKRSVGSIADEIASITKRMLEHQFILWEDTAQNTVATVGKNLALDTFLAGSSYTVTGPYLFLISSSGYSAISASDTMASHAGWTEAGNANAPTYTSPRKTAAWSSASAGAKALSAALTYAITGTGTVKGAAMVYGSGAVSTIDNTSGTLLSAGLFTGGDKAVVNTDSLNVSYSLAF